MPRPRLALFLSVIVAGVILAVPSTATAFGTIDGAGQRREHERITRAALACAEGVRSHGDCFEPRSIDQLAGHNKLFGAVGSPDSDEISDPAAHCDDADFLSESYPRTRETATVQLLDCVAHLRTRFREGIDSARDLLNEHGQIIAGEVDLDTDCAFFGNGRDRAKCLAIEGLGRALHGAQDFYAHSNWADEADPSRPIGADNPPGLHLPGPSPVLDLRGRGRPTVPLELTTGCYVLRDWVPGVEACEQRTTHAALNKDNGTIDPRTGTATAPTTSRGLVKENFGRAVEGAILETRRQWRDFRSELATRYGMQRASVMICALTRDDPITSCRGRQAGAAAIIVVVVVAVLATAALLSHARRRRRLV